MVVLAKNEVFEVSRAETLQKMQEVKKLLKTDIVFTNEYAIKVYYKGSDKTFSTPAIFTEEEAKKLLYELYQNGKLDLSEYCNLKSQAGVMY